MSCPNCGSSNINAVSHTEGRTKGFDCCSGLLGYIFLGPVGWLCGLCGMGKGNVTTDILFVCNNCGSRFKNILKQVND